MSSVTRETCKSAASLGHAALTAGRYAGLSKATNPICNLQSAQTMPGFMVNPRTAWKGQIVPVFPGGTQSSGRGCTRHTGTETSFFSAQHWPSTWLD